jgi:uncharacterized protein YbjT (DUF2867 family)
MMGGMKILLLGSNGFIGRQAAAVLAARADVGTLVLADYDIRTAKRISKKLSPKCTWAMVDAGKAGDLERLLHDFDVVASAVGPASGYERAILAGCAKNGLPVAVVGDGKMPDALRRETHDAFRAAGVPAVAGCGLSPGWTDLLLAHFLTGGTEGARTGNPVPFLYFSPDRFGGYAFFRRLVLERIETAVAPPGAPEGAWLSTADGALVGIQGGKASGRYRLLESTFGKLGAVGNEFFAAFWLWLRSASDAGKDAPAAMAGVFVPDADGGRTATVTDPEGKLAGATLAEAAVRLVAARERKEKGLLSPAALLGKKEAESIAESVGARISVAKVAPRA